MKAKHVTFSPFLRPRDSSAQEQGKVGWNPQNFHKRHQCHQHLWCFPW